MIVFTCHCLSWIADTLSAYSNIDDATHRRIQTKNYNIPPFFGAGLSQFRVRTRTPLPQLRRQSCSWISIVLLCTSHLRCRTRSICRKIWPATIGYDEHTCSILNKTIQHRSLLGHITSVAHDCVSIAGPIHGKPPLYSPKQLRYPSMNYNRPANVLSCVVD
jgi:hypothetical protein